MGYPGFFSAFPVSTSGDTLGTTVTWESADSSVLTITSRGIARGISVGSVTVSASADGIVASSTTIVRLIPIARIDVTPDDVDSVFVGDSLQLSVTLRDSADAPVLNRAVSWATSDTTIASVSTTGLVRTQGPGSFAVTARVDSTIGGIFLNSQLEVVSLSMPESVTVGLEHRVRLVPDYRSATGTHLGGRAVTWTNRAPSIVTLVSTGLVTPVAPGIAVIVADGFGFRDSTVVSVVPEFVAAVGFSEAHVQVFEDTTYQFRAVAVDSTGVTVRGARFTWTSSDSTVVQVRARADSDHIAFVTAIDSGRAVITAASGTAHRSVSSTVRLGIARFISVPDSLMIPIGEGRQLGGVGADRFGNRVDITTMSQTISPADTSIAQVDGSDQPPFIRARQSGRTVLYHTLSNGMADTVPVIIAGEGGVRLQWARYFIALPPYDTGTIVLKLADSLGTPDTVPRLVRFTIADTTVARAVPEITDFVEAETLTVVSGRHGFTTLTAQADSQFAMLFVTVDDVRPAVVRIDSAPPLAELGDTFRLVASVRGEDGVIRPFPVTWSTTNAARSAVSDSGVVTTLQLGEVSIVAQSREKADTVTFTVVSPDRPTVDAISPVPLVPGEQALIQGTGFDTDQAANVVRIDNVSVPVLSVTSTSLAVSLPNADAWECATPRSVGVSIHSGGRLAIDSAVLRTSTERTLMPGESVVLQGNEARCNEFGDGAYELIVANADTVNAASFALHFSGALPGSSPTPTNVESPLPIEQRSISAPISHDSVRRAAGTHRRILEESRSIALRVGPAQPLLRAARQLRPQLRVTHQINGIARIRIPRIEDPDFCASYRTIDARVVYAGTRALMFEDVQSPLAGTMDSYYRTVGEEFEQVMYPRLLEHFGDPLALDSLLDADGRIAMVFSPVVNAYGVGGFVVTCDFYPESVAPSSNTGEIFYAQTPTSPGFGFAGYTADVWRWLTRTVVMHEAKHLTAYAERLSRGAPPEDTWLEEGSAVLAEELWARGIYGTSWKGEATYAQTLRCDVRPTFAECADRPFSMFNAMAFLYEYMFRGGRTPLGPTAPDDASFYGSSWALLRWVIDHHATSESAFLKALVREPSLTGVANLEARAGRSFDEMLPEWGLALYRDGWGRSSPGPLSFPSWNIENIFVGMSNDFPLDFPNGGHPRELTSLVNGLQYRLPPGGWTIFGWGGAGSHLSAGSDSTGTPLSSTLRLFLARQAN